MGRYRTENSSGSGECLPAGLHDQAVYLRDYEEGKFLFSDPVSEYLPEWRHTVRWQRRENGTIELVPLEHPITVRDAAAMMCGLP